MQLKPFVTVILLFIAQSIVAQSIVAQSPESEEYPSPSSEEYPPIPSPGCESDRVSCPPGQHCCGFSPTLKYCLPRDATC
ncbi:hypothetical protein K443DRAFT_677959 [Laccaria amethystina LaAM-08-1]|uniref:Uncharacterized protein n=1 Tax=Laccaria amethystina LaAM-08-1 TaxID=1095629 RepID=A0A0C9Y1L2_9AGAR|nr:hypothetical protein K443DRAFT_677959 [Laccaria amethystina LaAM-08-1]